MSNWSEIKNYVVDLINEGKLSPLFSHNDLENELNASDETLDKCSLCYTNRKEHPLNTFKCSCQGYISICTNCLINDPNYDCYNNSYQCHKCKSVSQNKFCTNHLEQIINESERKERIEFERHINNNILNVFNYYNVEIPLYLPYDLINLIDINVIDSKEIAEIMLQNILTML